MKLGTLPLVITAAALTAACNSEPSSATVALRQGPADIVATIDTVRPDSANYYSVHVTYQNMGAANALIATCPVGVQRLTQAGWTLADDQQCAMSSGEREVDVGKSVGLWSISFRLVAGDSIRALPVSAIIPVVPAGTVVAIDGGEFAAGTPSVARLVQN